MSKKKVIVFIVEGFSDKEALNGILSELYDRKRFVFSIIDGDITTQNSTNANNIRAKIGDSINKSREKDKFSKKDIEMVVHLIDTDGIYIPNQNVINNDTVDVLYNNDNIETKDVNGIISRNNKKKLILNVLTTMTSIHNVPYSIFFMSCNLDHVLYNSQNAIKSEKVNLAHSFSEKYIDNPEDFVIFMSKSEFTVKGTYDYTWNFIKKDLNSLHRHSNFHLFFDKIHD